MTMGYVLHNCVVRYVNSLLKKKYVFHFKRFTTCGLKILLYFFAFAMPLRKQHQVKMDNKSLLLGWSKYGVI